MQHATRTGWQVVWSWAYRQEHRISYHVWVDLLRQAMQRCTSLLYQPLSVLLPELVPLLHEVAPSVRGPEQEEMLLWEARMAWLIVLSKDAPLLLVNRRHAVDRCAQCAALVLSAASHSGLPHCPSGDLS